MISIKSRFETLSRIDLKGFDCFARKIRKRFIRPWMIKKFITSLILPVAFVFLLWVIKISEIIFNLDFSGFGILPGSFKGMPGILFAPLIHANIKHIFSNSIPLLFLGSGIIYFYRNSSYKGNLNNLSRNRYS